MKMVLTQSQVRSICSNKRNAGWWFGTCFIFNHILGIIIPTDFHIFQRGWYTTNQNDSVARVTSLFWIHQDRDETLAREASEMSENV